MAGSGGAARGASLQAAAELGLVGLTLVLVLSVSIGRAVVGGDPNRAAAAAGLAAVALHSGMDFLWHIPAIPLVCAALVAVACPPRKGVTR